MDKNLLSGNTGMLVLQLLSKKDMYGYEMIVELEEHSEKVFELKTGTLYPLLHSLEQKGYITSYENTESARVKRYYSITKRGRKALGEKKEEWKCYSNAVNKILESD